MKIIIASRGNLARFRAYFWAKRIGWPIRVVISQAQRERIADLRKAGVAASDIVVSVPPPFDHPLTNISYERQWIQDNLTRLDEWYVTLDDNVEKVTGLPPHLHDALKWTDTSPWGKAQFNYEFSPEEVASLIEVSRGAAEEVGSPMCGFAIENNPFYRKNHWQLRGYVRTSFSVQQNRNFNWNPWPSCMFEDFVVSVEAVARTGYALVNRFAKPQKPEFEAGGIGALEARVPWLTDNCKRLMEMYPGLLSFVKDREYSLTFAKRSDETVNIWRREHGFL